MQPVFYSIMIVFIGCSIGLETHLPNWSLRETSHQRRQPLPVPEPKKSLARQMKRKFLDYRNHLKETIDNEERNRIHPITSQSGTTQSPTDQFLSKYPPITFLSKAKRPESNNIPKTQRAAGEGPSGLRPSGLGVEAHPVEDSFPGLLLSEHDTSELRELESLEDSDGRLLDSRLGPMGTSSFDPSIVVDFRLLSLPQTHHSEESRSKARRPQRPHITLSERPTYNGNPSTRSVSSGFTPPQQIVPDVPKILPNQTQSFEQDHEPMSVYVASNSLQQQTSYTDYFTGESKAQEEPNFQEETSRNSEMSEVMLPQSVRDSLRKYLKPLLSALKPLTKSVPGLPGLDYPILSVVPYTNFYCSNMPWPGFYADTEARCQTWHACDVDGRQASFLCPNGTVFNQALMVCDWWYNSDCLTAPFLYSLNERLFGHLKAQQPMPYRRITPQLLDTIFT